MDALNAWNTLNQEAYSVISFIGDRVSFSAYSNKKLYSHLEPGIRFKLPFFGSGEMIEKVMTLFGALALPATPNSG
jgi:hypothetical protein